MRIRRSRPTGDFLQVPNATVRDARLSHMARGILVELLSRPDGWEATADDMWRASVAEHGKASPGRRAFRAAFAELKDQGYLTAGRDVLPGGRHATVLILTDVPHAGTSARAGQTREPAGGADVPDVGTSVPPAETQDAPGRTDVPHAGTSEDVTDVPPAGTSVRPAETVESAGHSDVPPAGTPAPPGQTALFAGRSDVPHAGTSLKEHELQNTENTSSSAPPASPAPDLTAFGAFWLVYPKKRDKQEALKAWKAAVASGVAPQKITDAAAAYARERAGQDPQYTKYPATWLNKGCYDDEPDPPASRPPLRAVSGSWTQPNRPHPMTGAAAPAPTADDYKNAKPF